MSAFRKMYHVCISTCVFQCVFHIYFITSLFHDTVQQPELDGGEGAAALIATNPFLAIVSNTSLTAISALAEVSKKSTSSPHSFARASPSVLGTARSSGKSTLLPQSATGGIGFSSRSFIWRSSSNLALASSTLALSIIE